MEPTRKQRLVIEAGKNKLIVNWLADGTMTAEMHSGPESTPAKPVPQLRATRVTQLVAEVLKMLNGGL